MSKRSRINECGHAEKKHHSFGMCANCRHHWRCENDPGYRENLNAKGREHYRKDPQKHMARTVLWRTKNAERNRSIRRKSNGIVAAHGKTGEGEVCQICNCTLVLEKGARRACLDHDHRTGLIRGWLCDSCNRGIGFLKDSPAVLTAALAYLLKHTVT